MGQTLGAETILPASSGLAAPPSIVVTEVGDMDSTSNGASEITSIVTSTENLVAPSPPPPTLTPFSPLHLVDRNEMGSGPLILEKDQQGKHRRLYPNPHLIFLSSIPHTGQTHLPSRPVLPKI